MTLQARLENLRNKPEHVRKQIALGGAFGITLIITAFWVASFTSVGKNTQQAVASAVSQAGTPASSLVASVGGFFEDLKDLIFSPRKVTYSEVEVSPGK